MTLIEVLVSLGIMSLIASVLYGAFDGMARARESLERTSDRYQQGRIAMTRMARELQSAFISLHVPLDPNLVVSRTAFVGDGSRIDFTSFSHQRVNAGTHESDQNELSYFISPNPEGSTVDLARRESKYIDADPQHGGVIQVLAENINAFNVQYFDPVTGQWQDNWDTTNQTVDVLHLPQQVRLTLTLNQVTGPPIPFETKVWIPIQTPLSFGVPR